MPKLVSRPYENRRLRRIADRVEGSSVLDLGYAQHPNTYYKSNVHRVGLDLAKPKFESGYQEELIGNACELASVLGDRQFDTIVAAELIEHVEQPYDFLRGLKHHIAPGGLLLLTTPNPLGWPVVIAEYLRNKQFFYTEDHLYYFAPRWVERMLERSGFSIEAVEGLGFWLPKAVIPIRSPSFSYQVLYAARLSN